MTSFANNGTMYSLTDLNIGNVLLGVNEMFWNNNMELTLNLKNHSSSSFQGK